MHATLLWDIYEITTEHTPIHGVMLRGRVRKFGIEKNLNVLCENATDIENCVRFALLVENEPRIITDYLESIIADVHIKQVMPAVRNPVLSKLKVNNLERYSL